MLKYYIIALFVIVSLNVNAQASDTLFAVRKGNNWSVKYTAKKGENIQMLAQRFYISGPILEYENQPDNIKNLNPGQVIFIPVTVDNYYVNKQSLLDNNVRELYYRVEPKDNIGMISTYAGVTKAQMRAWNNLKGNTVVPGQTLFVGWLKMMARDTTNLASLSAYPSFKKTVVADEPVLPVPGGLDTVYDRQTSNGTNILTEKGAAVFFENAGRNGIYYAFHNATIRGSIIKVYNPGSGKTVYVKVIGPVPGTKFYANSIIGISSAAKEALGVTDNKAWCELSYSPN
jgi:LysM repeat protein